MNTAERYYPFLSRINVNVMIITDEQFSSHTSTIANRNYEIPNLSSTW